MAGGLQDLAVARANLLSIPPKHLIPDPDNDRTDYGNDIPEMAADIAARGLDHPIKVRLVEEGGKKKAMVVDGHRRLTAIRYAIEHLNAEIESVPCFPEARGTSPDQRVIDRLKANEGQKPFTPMEEAAAFKKLLTMGVPAPEIAKRIGKKTGYVNSRLDLLAAPRDVRDAVDRGQVKPSAAKVLAKAEPEKRRAILQKTEPRTEGGKAPRMTAAAVKQEMGVRSRITTQAEMEKLLESVSKRLVETNSNYWQGFREAILVFMGEKTYAEVLDAFDKVWKSR